MVSMTVSKTVHEGSNPSLPAYLLYQHNWSIGTEVVPLLLTQLRWVRVLHGSLALEWEFKSPDQVFG